MTPTLQAQWDAIVARTERRNALAHTYAAAGLPAANTALLVIDEPAAPVVERKPEPVQEKVGQQSLFG